MTFERPKFIPPCAISLEILSSAALGTLLVLRFSHLLYTKEALAVEGGVPTIRARVDAAKLPKGKYVLAMSGDPFFAYCSHLSVLATILSTWTDRQNERRLWGVVHPRLLRAYRKGVVAYVCTPFHLWLLPLMTLKVARFQAFSLGLAGV